MSNVEKFTEVFNRLEEWMRHNIDIDSGSRRTIAHSKLIDRLALQNPYVKEYASRLHAFRSLRNALIHWPKTEKGQSIAEPHLEVIEEYYSIYQKLQEPPTVGKIAIPIEKVTYCLWEDRISDAIGSMVDNNFRQVPIVSKGDGGVYLEGVFDLFHYGKISFAQCREHGQFHLSKSDTFEKYKSVLELENGSTDSLSAFVRSDETVLDAERKFIEHFQRIKLLETVYITKTGTVTAPLLGLFTAHDIPSLSGKLT